MSLILFSFEDYKSLTLTELGAVQDYMDRNDPTALGGLIQQDYQLTPDFRRFIADLVTGKKKRPIKKASTFDRDYAIYQEIDDAVSNGSTKTAIKKVIAGRISLSMDAIQKAYKRVDKEVKESHKTLREEEEAEYREAQEEHWEAINKYKLNMENAI